MSNYTDQQTRRQVLKDNYLSRAQNDAEMSAGGRFKQQTQTHVTSLPQYPHQPENSPWSQSLDELTGREPPLETDPNFVGELGGVSAPVVVVTVEAANATDRGASPTALTGAPHFRRREW